MSAKGVALPMTRITSPPARLPPERAVMPVRAVSPQIASNRPVLVTGSHRSGSTWVGRMLAAAPGVRYLHEPFHVRRFPCWCGLKEIQWYQYVSERSGEPWADHFRHVFWPPLGRHAAGGVAPGRGSTLRANLRITWDRWLHPRVLVKDPLALFSSEWLAGTFGMDVVAIVRHPAAFTTSLRAKNWNFDFQNLVAQPLFMEERLQTFAAEIHRLAANPPEILEQSILLWRIIYSQVRDWREKCKHWSIVRHEDLSRNPLEEYRQLYARLGLRFTPKVEATVRAASSGDNPCEASPSDAFSVKRDSQATIHAWKSRLTPGEILTIRRGVEDVSASFYADCDW